MVEEGRSVLCLQPMLQPEWVCFKHYKTITLTNSSSRLLVNLRRTQAF